MSDLICPHCGQTSSDLSSGTNCPLCQQPLNVACSTERPETGGPGPEGEVEKVAPGGPGPEGEVEKVAPPPKAHHPTKEWVGKGPAQDVTAVTVKWEIDGLLLPPEGKGELGQLGSYRILDILGGGGMGIVFRALDPALDRKVAIKAMLPGAVNVGDNRQRFLREARAMAAQNHVHIITIYYFGEDRGFPYMAMELLEGESLDHRMQRTGLLPIEEIARIGSEIAEGLAAAHERHLIHRDIKPANIWLEGERGLVKILDFGLARVLTDDVYITKPGTILGTPAYMSPEQARGGAVDYRTDLFSLGAILYQLCTGKVPFTGENSFAVLTALALETPRAIYEANSDVPPALVNLVTALLAKNPEDRPASARAVVEMLEVIRRDMLRGDILGLDGVEPGLEDDCPMAEAVEDVPEADPVDDAEETIVLPEAVEDLVGCTLGHYAIRSQLGRGQHGLVFRARDMEKGRIVALKVLDPEFPKNDREIQLFSKAMSAMLPIQHPNIVSVLAAGKTDQFCWIAMEFVEGESLDSAMKRWAAAGERRWQRAFRIAVDIGQALLAMRQRRLIHGNITLRNILVRNADQSAKLNDLMLQKALRNSQLYRNVFDRKLAEEVFFLSTEQVDGASSFIDHLCDLYGLGVAVYYVLTGRPPFQGATVEETMSRIRDGVPESPRKFNKSIPREFEQTVLRMLSKRQEDRFQSPDELLADLRFIARRHDIQP